MIKKQLNRVLYFLLEKEARLVLKKYKPKIVAVVGSGYKAPTSHALMIAMSKFCFVRQEGQNLHLAILGFMNKPENLWSWILILTEGLALIILPNHYPEWLIFESRFDEADYFVNIDEESKLTTKDYEVVYDEHNLPKGMTFKILDIGQENPVYLDGTIGEGQIRPILKAIDLCGVLGEPLSVLAKTFSDRYEPIDGYMKLIKGIKGSIIIDDSLDASIELIINGVKNLKSLDKSKRKIAIIGDILELEKGSIEAHKSIGQEINGGIDMLVIVGIRARHIAEEALNNGYPESKVYQFDEAGEAGDFIQNLIEAGDVIYVSGSNGMHMERVVEEIKF